MSDPILYSIIVYKIKEKNKSCIVSKSDLNYQINLMIRNSFIPKFLKKDIINDLIKFKLIKIINYNSCIIDKDCYKRVERIMQNNS